MSRTSPGSDGPTRVEPGWYADPNGRFDVRYHNGTDWTGDVSTAGRRFVDPLGAAPAETARSGRSRRATASMVLGIVAVGIGWMPYLAVAGAICALTAIALGVSARRRAGGAAAAPNSARVGIITGAVGLLVAAVGIAFTVLVARALDRYVDPQPNRATIESCRSDGEGTVTAAGQLTNLGDDDGDFTVRIAVVRAGTDSVHRTGRVELDDVAAAETVPFELTLRAALDDAECRIEAVDGPLPFGLDIPAP